MVRPKSNLKKVMVSIWLEPSSIQVLDSFANQVRITRSQAIHNFLEVGCDEIGCKPIDLVKLSFILRDLKTKVQPFLSNSIPTTSKSIESKPKKESVSARIDSKLINRIDQLSTELGFTRKNLIESILEADIKEMEILMSVPGLMKAVVTLKDITELSKKHWEKIFKNSVDAIEKKSINLI